MKVGVRQDAMPISKKRRSESTNRVEKTELTVRERWTGMQRR